MATKRTGQERQVLPSEVALAGILALLIEEREERGREGKSAEKIEVLLSKAGLSNEEIAAVTGKQPSAVRMAVSRAKPKKGND